MICDCGGNFILITSQDLSLRKIARDTAREVSHRHERPMKDLISRVDKARHMKQQPPTRDNPPKKLIGLYANEQRKLPCYRPFLMPPELPKGSSDAERLKIGTSKCLLAR